MIVSSDRKTVVMSLKPRYSDLIVEGQKTVELRRQPISNLEGRDVYVYATSPAMELRCGFKVAKVVSGSVLEVWTQLFDRTGICKKEFLKYFAGCATAYALEIEAVWMFKNPVSLDNLRDSFGGFVVPQSWRYVTDAEQAMFECFEKSLIGLCAANPGVDS